jgi:hypothetical protein
MIPLQGTPVSYAVTPGQGVGNGPTVVIKMSEGALLTAAGGKKTPAKKPAPRRKR